MATVLRTAGSLEPLELTSLRRSLLQHTRAWADGSPDASAATDIRHTLLTANHAHYRDRVQVYAELCDGLGIESEDIGMDTLVNELMFSDQIFKSYDIDAFARSDFATMTDWLRTLFAGEINAEARTPTTLKAWRQTLHGQDIHLNYSSGTSGQMSFIPRDGDAWQALSRNSQSYSDSQWFFSEQGRPKPYACLVAGPKGTGMGIQAAATGLARMAARSHFLFDSELDEEAVRDLTLSGVAEPRPGGEALGHDSASAHAYQRAFEFLSSCHAQGLRALVFGAPFQIRRLCQQFKAFGLAIELPDDSVVSSGGGWKSFSNERVSRRALLELINETLGVAPARFIDAYSTAEINCAFLSCEFGHYHIPPLIEAVVLDEAYTGHVGRSGVGLLGFLDPFATSYPGFIVTGDMATLAFGACDCGLTGAYLDGEVQRAVGKEIKGCGGVMAATLA
jgi:hypothetical protein